nr:MAG TPA: hypothetical protein [Caudoviricetes sp.]
MLINSILLHFGHSRKANIRSLEHLFPASFFSGCLCPYTVGFGQPNSRSLP